MRDRAIVVLNSEVCLGWRRAQAVCRVRVEVMVRVRPSVRVSNVGLGSG